MNEHEFDRFAGDYNKILEDSMPVGLSENAYFAEYKIEIIANRLKEKSINRVLDYGCGAGRSLSFLQVYFPKAEIWGYDVSEISIKEATKNAPEAKLFSDWSTKKDGPFDVILAANVFHHIPPKEHPTALLNCLNSLHPQGQIFIFEHNPYNPLSRYIFERCPFDVDAKMLNLKNILDLAKRTNCQVVDQGYTLFFPKPLKFMRRMERKLKWLPLGAQYYVQLAH